MSLRNFKLELWVIPRWLIRSGPWQACYLFCFFLPCVHACMQATGWESGSAPRYFLTGNNKLSLEIEGGVDAGLRRRGRSRARPPLVFGYSNPICFSTFFVPPRLGGKETSRPCCLLVLGT
ncbi:hypothetical protein BDW02DRAFT_383276 [Decorospora gaudefroyi]|uniref:Secreted protein n=1 Tax=Decorospora gaudefroyi TaxID=184978 RepID=A0A6A5K7Q7_9PLEO|nr:hypothetical protein BDW02DRAFT_383276 [Decorospora gaudefroyi]